MSAIKPAAIFVWNERAGTAAAGEPLRGACDEHFAAIHTTTDDAEEALGNASRDLSLVVAAGGDGTINTVINALGKTGSPAAFGVLPLGTGNDFCRSLAIPLDPYVALRLLVEGRSRVIDIGVLQTDAGERRFGNVATAGNSHQVKQQMTSEMKAQWGALCYVRGAVAALANLQGYEATLKIDDQPDESLSLWNIMIANGEFSGGGMSVAPGARVDDGWLDVVAVLDGTPIDVATLTANFVLGNFLEHESVRHWRARRVVISSNPPLEFSLDGETHAGQRYEFCVVPRALRVIAPSGADSAA